jgi:hypothetical protein
MEAVKRGDSPEHMPGQQFDIPTEQQNYRTITVKLQYPPKKAHFSKIISFF